MKHLCTVCGDEVSSSLAYDAQLVWCAGLSPTLT